MRTAIAAVVSSLALLACIAAPAGAKPSPPPPPPPPGQDSVVLTGVPAFVGIIGGGSITINVLNATSGPGGENPTGEVNLVLAKGADSVPLGGEVTCLAVSGHTATLNFADHVGLVAPPNNIFTVQVADNQPDTFFLGREVGRAPTDCSPPASPSNLGGVVAGSGIDITVVDAPVAPTSKGQCVNGGWGQFGSMFQSQGQCVAYVERGPKPRHQTEEPPPGVIHPARNRGPGWVSRAV